MEPLDYKVIDLEGKEVGKVALNPNVFNAPIVEHIVHDVVVWQLAKRRAGTHSAQRIGDMEGGGAKPWRQKGTGRARCGTNNSPLWVGGAKIHAPHPREYGGRITQRTRRQALASALSDRVGQSGLIVLDSLHVDGIKTKEFTTLLKNIGLKKIGLKKIGVSAENVLLVLPSEAGAADKISKSCRNIPGVTALSVEGVNVYDILRHKFLVCTKEAVSALEKRVSAESV